MSIESNNNLSKFVRMDEREPQEVPTIDVPEATTFPVLQGKVAIVTGAAMGMGKATAIVSFHPSRLGTY